MHIVYQSVPILHSLFPPYPLLAAPPQRKLLAAPPIAGLLPAKIAPRLEIIIDVPLTREEFLRQLGPIRSREEMNADLVAILAPTHWIFSVPVLLAARNRSKGAIIMTTTMNDIILPEPEDYRVQLEQIITETRSTIKEALGYIERQEDGPLTMRFALKDIDHSVTAIESEMRFLTGTLNKYQTFAAELLEQRDEAIRQRNLLANGGDSD